MKEETEKAALGAGTSESGSDTNDLGSVNDGAIIARKVRKFNGEY